MLLFEIVPKECEPAPRPNSHRQADPIQAIIRFIFVYGAEVSDDRDTRSEPLAIIINIRPISLTSRPSVERMSSKPSQSDGEAAFRTVLHWIGEDPDRDGLRETPSRVARAFQEYFAGYGQDPEQVLRKTFEEIDGYDEMVVLRGIPFQSHCEHHMAPIVGQAWVAYVPDQLVVGVLQAGSGGRIICQAASDSGTSHGANRQHNREGSPTKGCRCGGQGGSSLHVNARHYSPVGN